MDCKNNKKGKLPSNPGTVFSPALETEQEKGKEIDIYCWSTYH
jgi:hypothetical protein